MNRRGALLKGLAAGGLLALGGRAPLALAQSTPTETMRAEINAVRRVWQRPDLTTEPRLTLVAQRMAEAVARGLDAQTVLNDIKARLDGASYPRRAHFALLRGGSPTAGEIVALWRADRGARDGLLAEGMEEIGVGYAGNAQASAGLPRDIWVVVLADPLRPASAGWKEDVIARVNAFRGRNTLPPLRPDPLLDRAAQAHAEDMLRRDYVAHESPEGSQPGDRVLRVGYRYSRIAENLTVGPETPAEAVQAWIDSPPHRRAMLLTDVDEIGAGYVFTPRDGGRQVFHHYWTLLLGRR
jgi:uncharacterized protein YkwD